MGVSRVGPGNHADPPTRSRQDGGRINADHRQQTTLQADELRSYDFRHAEQLPELTIPRLVCRVTAGIQARANGPTADLEHGESPETGA
ncbi:hypothetical protein OHU45_16535 [Streptomyces tubercidicus]|uniref:hypothetical protein n=1 Tax=Streptomyces tubercidicus TaxID=47759 RepID=UPI0032458F42